MMTWSEICDVYRLLAERLEAGEITEEDYKQQSIILAKSGGIGSVA